MRMERGSRVTTCKRCHEVVALLSFVPSHEAVTKEMQPHLSTSSRRRQSTVELSIASPPTHHISSASSPAHVQSAKAPNTLACSSKRTQHGSLTSPSLCHHPQLSIPFTQLSASVNSVKRIRSNANTRPHAEHLAPRHCGGIVALPAVVPAMPSSSDHTDRPPQPSSPLHGAP